MTTPARLIVLMAFSAGENGELMPAFDPREFQSEDRAEREARMLWGTGKYVGVIAWSREAEPDIGEYGPPKVLFQSGETPDME